MTGGRKQRSISIINTASRPFSSPSLSSSTWQSLIVHDQHLSDQPLSDEPSPIDQDADVSPDQPKHPKGQSNHVRVQVSSAADSQTDHPSSSLARLRLTSIQKNILKCAIAYTLASLFTYVQPLSALVSLPFDEDGPINAHFVCTVATYYNPAKTVGSMIEANLFMLWAALFSVIVCFGSMATAVILNNDGLEWLSHTTIVCFWLTGSYGFIAYMKTKVGKATFGSACSMTALINAVIILKEGAVHLGRFEVDAIMQMLFIVLLGIGCSNLVCFTLWRGSATSLLQKNINKTLDSFATLTALLTNTFLLEADASTSHEQLEKAIAAHEASFNSLKTNLEDAKLELFDAHMPFCVPIYDEIVKSMTRLAQHITGLRAGCSYQGKVLQARKLAGNVDIDHMALPMAQVTQLYGAEAAVFLAFKGLVGPSLVSLAAKCRSALKRSKDAFLQDDVISQDLEHELRELAQDIKQQTTSFSESYGKALKKLYRQPEQHASVDLTEESSSVKAGEAIFLVYFYLFNLESFAQEVIQLLQLCRKMCREIEHVQFGRGPQNGHSSRRKRRSSILRKRLLTLVPVSKSEQLFPQAQLAAETSHPVDGSQMSWFGYLQYRLWRASLNWRSDDMKFAIKTGIGAGLLGLPAFLDSTRPTWLKYRGEWSMISFVVVIASSSSQANWNAFFRIVGTIAGSLSAVIAYHLSGANPYVLVPIGFLFSLPNFWLIVTRPKWATTGRFVLLAYNLTALYAYNKREEDLHVSVIALRRSIAVCVGSLLVSHTVAHPELKIIRWAWLVAVGVWPYEARTELRTGLADLFHNSAFLFTKLVKAYSKPADSVISSIQKVPSVQKALDRKRGHVTASERTSLLTKQARQHLREEVQAFASMELVLQKQILKLNNLLSQTHYEPRIKGPFPMAEYRQVLQASQSILDQLHAMRCVTTRQEWIVDVRRDFVLPVQRLRREMVGNILLYFNTLASAARSKTAMPLFMPPANEARERLVAAIRKLDVVKTREVKQSSTYLLYYAYSLAIKDLIEKLDEIGHIMQDLFGVVGGKQIDFEGMFAAENVFDALPVTPNMQDDELLGEIWGSDVEEETDSEHS